MCLRVMGVRPGARKGIMRRRSSHTLSGLAGPIIRLMKFSAVVRRICHTLAAASTVLCVAAGASTAQANAPLKYPATPRSAQGDDLNGVAVADPYRWLEAVASPEVRAWVSAENAL